MSRRFFVAGQLLEASGWTPLPEEVVRHAVRVLRLRDDDKVRLCAPDGRSATVRLSQQEGIWGFEREGAVERDEDVGQRAVWLLPAMFKAQRFDWLLEKAAELGASAVAPFTAERSVVHWKDDKIGRKLERCERIMLEATRQSGGARPPLFLPPEPLQERLQSALEAGLHVLWAHPESDATLQAVVSALPPAAGVAIITGPEGGLTKSETGLLAQHGTGVRLGRRILRAETAPLAMLAFLRLADS